jgi:hypothetical protein
VSVIAGHAPAEILDGILSPAEIAVRLLTVGRKLPFHRDPTSK